MTKKRAIIYHHDDPDGHVAGGIVMNALKELHPGDYTFEHYPKNYEDEFLDHDRSDLADTDVEIYMVDLSFTKMTVQKIIDALSPSCVKHFVWIDHHASSEETALDLSGFLEDMGDSPIAKHLYDFNIIFDNGLCGAALTYLWYQLMKDFFTNGDKDPFRFGSLINDINTAHDADSKTISCTIPKLNNKTISIPEFLYHLDAYDRWTRADPECNAFLVGLKTMGDGYWFTDTNAIYDGMTTLVNTTYAMNCISNGNLILRYQKNEYKDQEDLIAIRELYGTRLAFKNGVGNSWNFLDLLDTNYVEAGIIGRYNPVVKMWMYSIYANKRNSLKVNKVAEGFINGGGHPGAAGFRLKECLFDMSDADLYVYLESNYPKVVEALGGGITSTAPTFTASAPELPKAVEEVTSNLKEPMKSTIHAEVAKEVDTSASAIGSSIPKEEEESKPKLNFRLDLDISDREDRIFLGGTCSFPNIVHTTYRDIIKKFADEDLYFDPVVDNWNAEAQKKEDQMKAICKYHLYVFYPCAENIYSMYESARDLAIMNPDCIKVYFVNGFDATASYTYWMNPKQMSVAEKLTKDYPESVKIVTPSELTFELGGLVTTVIKDARQNR